MHPLLRISYSLGLSFYHLLVKIAALKNNKAKEFLSGRTLSAQSLDFNHPAPNQTCVWFHCASLGEFEQAKPIIQQLKTYNPSLFIALSFYSPSGYLPSQNYALASWLGYLPLDYPRDCARFLDKLKPQIAVFIKYELWPEMLHQMKQRKIPHYLVAARFSLKNPLLAPFKSLYLKPLLRGFERVFAQDHDSFTIASQWLTHSLQLSGDTRIDRVLELKNESCAQDAQIVAFKKNKKLLLLGSSWSEEENILLKAMPQLADFTVIIAPHDIQRCDEIKRKFAEVNPVLFTDYIPAIHDSNLLILNTMGMLSKLYRHADIAWVGGGFKNALHNTFEPLAYGVPICFGPHTSKFHEAKTLLALKIAFPIHNVDTLLTVCNMNSEKKSEIKKASHSLLEQNKGVAGQITSTLIEKLKKDSPSV
jgi:3-deoxy-D-manno-octulosonic-acid transferase